MTLIMETVGSKSDLIWSKKVGTIFFNNFTKKIINHKKHQKFQKKLFFLNNGSYKTFNHNVIYKIFN
jgi:hypothetical protein